MKKFIRENGVLLVIIAVLLAAIIFVLSFFFGDPIGSFLGFITTPVRNGVSSAADWVEGIYADNYQVEQMKEELERLRHELADMSEQVRESEQLRAENENYRQLLGLRERRRELEYESCTVTAHALSNWESSFTISKGSNFGLKEGLCVIDPYGNLVGVIDEVGLNWANVITVVDTGIEMGALMSRTDAAAILEGDFTLMQEGRLKLSYLPEGTEINAGDQVLTSGKGGVYPPNILVGKVESVHNDPSGMTRYAVVAPAADLGSLKQVFVITGYDIVE